jgi:predicted molibdopterin-dependent oxidoreductase YjgC
MFRRLPDADLAPAVAVTVSIDGVPQVARAGDTVAAVLLAAGRSAFRTTPVAGAPRGPYCLMGTCFDCLVTIDGVADRQACLEPVAAGMRIETRGRPA